MFLQGVLGEFTQPWLRDTDRIQTLYRSIANSSSNDNHLVPNDRYIDLCMVIFLTMYLYTYLLRCQFHLER